MLNIFKIGRGDFFGTFIPGSFLLINFIFVFPETLNCFKNQNMLIPLNSTNIITIPLLFIISYTLGFALRLIKPSTIELLSSFLWMPRCIIRSFIKYYKKNPKHYKLKVIIKKDIKLYWESFPYITWFFDIYLPSTPIFYQKFYKRLLNNQFNKNMENMENMKGLSFINICKIFILENSKYLYDEIVFCEGLVRFLSGMSLSLILSIIILLLTKSGFDTILYVYLFLFILFLMKLRFIRHKEVTTVFDSFAFTFKARKV